MTNYKNLTTLTHAAENLILEMNVTKSSGTRSTPK